MKINGVSTYQILDEIADIVLSVEFTRDEIKEYQLIATTVWVTYDLKGNFLQSEIADQGISANLELTKEELKQVMEYIEENGLKDELLRQLRERVS